MIFYNSALLVVTTSLEFLFVKYGFHFSISEAREFSIFLSVLKVPLRFIVHLGPSLVSIFTQDFLPLSFLPLLTFGSVSFSSSLFRLRLGVYLRLFLFSLLVLTYVTIILSLTMFTLHPIAADTHSHSIHSS